MIENSACHRLEGLEAGCFQYEIDCNLQDKMNSIPFLSSLGEWLVDNVAKNMEYELSGESFAVAETSQPELWRIYRETCVVLGVSEFPLLYVVPGQEINAFTIGVDNAVICVTNRTVDNCKDDELKYIFGHEIGHVMCAHTKFLTLLRYAAIGSQAISDAFVALWPLLKKWSRAAEISADRAGLLACQNFETCSASLLKLSGFPHSKEMIESPTNILLRQVELHQRAYGEFGLVRRCWKEFSHAIMANHPRIVERFECLREWVEMGCFDEVVQATPAERHKIAQNMVCDVQWYDLCVQSIFTAAEYFRARFGLSHRDTLSDLRRAFLSRIQIKGPVAERLLMANLIVRRIASEKVGYELQLYVRMSERDLVRVLLPVLYDENDWSFVPRAFREKMIHERVDEFQVGLYQLG